MAATLALDLGGRRIGVAVNPAGSIILELPTIQRLTHTDVLPTLLALIDEYQVDTVVVGRPRSGESEQAGYIQELRTRLPARVYELEESLTTKEAERQLAAEGVRGDSDARAARLILEQYFAERLQ